MSNYLGVATATETIAQVIRDAVSPVIPGVEVTTERPDKAGKDGAARVNVFLYQALPNPSLRNDDLPLRAADGTLASRPRTPLDLHYLVSFYGPDKQLIPQQLLGLTASALHQHAVLTRADVLRAVKAAPGGFLDGSDLGETTGLKVSPFVHSLEEQSKLWSVMFHVPYALSMAYLCTVVVIDGPPAGSALPVRGGARAVAPTLAPVVAAVAAATPGSLIVAGSTIVIIGKNLAGGGTRVLVGDVVLTPASADVSDTRVAVALTDSRLSSGTASLAVATDAGTSPPATFVLAPTVTRVSLRRVPGPPVLRVGVDPAVRSDDAVTLLLNAGPGGTSSASYAFDMPAPPANAPVRSLKTVAIPIPGVPAGTWLVRLRVNGVESPLGLAPEPEGRTVYATPRVRIS